MLGALSFTVTNFVIQPSVVSVGQPVSISATVINDSSLRVGVHLYCRIDRTDLEVKATGWLDPGESKTLGWEFTSYDPKTYSVRIQAGEWPYTSRTTVFEGSFTVLPAGDILPVGISIPPVIAPGAEFWAQHTVKLVYTWDCYYFISLALVGTGANWNIETTAAEAWYVDHRWMLPKEEKGEFFPRAYPLFQSGEYTFRGIPKADYDWVTGTHGPVYQTPAKATYRKNSFEYPLPEGIYEVKSYCSLKLIEYADKDHASYYSDVWVWKDLGVGQVEITGAPEGQFSEFSIPDYRKV